MNFELILSAISNAGKLYGAAKDLIALAKGAKETLKQKGELTQAQEDEFDREIDRVTAQEHWQPEKP